MPMIAFIGVAQLVADVGQEVRLRAARRLGLADRLAERGLGAFQFRQVDGDADGRFVAGRSRRVGAEEHRFAQPAGPAHLASRGG